MLDPKSLAERQDEIAESCRRRGVRIDLDATIAAQQQANALQQELQELNERRNQHQAAGKRKLSDTEREEHSAEGRRMKQQVSAV